MAILPQKFYLGDTVEIARALVGKYLIRQDGGALLAGRICEAEAYVGRADRACHAYQYRRTPRTAPLFAAPGTAYVYLVYGLHCCLNLVTEPEGEPAAVLLRGLLPRYGLEAMAQNRYRCSASAMTPYQRKNLLNGPGKLCAALAVDRSLNGLPYGSPDLFVCERLSDIGLPEPLEDRTSLTVHVGTRIGVDYAGEAAGYPWRFYC